MFFLSDSFSENRRFFFNFFFFLCRKLAGKDFAEILTKLDQAPAKLAFLKKAKVIFNSVFLENLRFFCFYFINIFLNIFFSERKLVRKVT